MATSSVSPLPIVHADERYRADDLGVDWILTSEERHHIAKLLGVSGTLSQNSISIIRLSIKLTCSLLCLTLTTSFYVLELVYDRHDH